MEAAEARPPRPAKPDEAGAVAFGGGAVIPSLEPKNLENQNSAKKNYN